MARALSVAALLLTLAVPQAGAFGAPREAPAPVSTIRPAVATPAPAAAPAAEHKFVDDARTELTPFCGALCWARLRS